MRCFRSAVWSRIEDCLDSSYQSYDLHFSACGWISPLLCWSGQTISWPHLLTAFRGLNHFLNLISQTCQKTILWLHVWEKQSNISTYLYLSATVLPNSKHPLATLLHFTNPFSSNHRLKSLVLCLSPRIRFSLCFRLCLRLSFGLCFGFRLRLCFRLGLTFSSPPSGELLASFALGVINEGRNIFSIPSFVKNEFLFEEICCLGKRRYDWNRVAWHSK